MSPDRRPAQLATFAKAVFARLTSHLEQLQLLHETLARKMLP